MRRLLATAGLVLALAGTTASCAGRDPGTPNGSCAFVVRRDGHQYADAGFVEQDFEKIGTAEVAGCRDSGPQALGPYFGDDPESIEVSRVGDLDPSLVLATRDDPGSGTLRVLVSLDAPPDQVDAVMAELSR